MIVADCGRKRTELITHDGTLESAREIAEMYADDGRYKIKRRYLTEQGLFWRDVREVGDYQVEWKSY